MSINLLIFLLAISFLTALLASLKEALRSLGKPEVKALFQEEARLFFLKKWLPICFKEKKWEGLFFSITFIRDLLLLSYLSIPLFFSISSVALFLFCLWGSYFLFHISLKFLARKAPRSFILGASLPLSCLLALFLPFTTLFFPWLEPKKKIPPDPEIRHLLFKNKILELLYESEISCYIDNQERKLILSMAFFKDRIVREIMIPRTQVISLNSESSVAEAVKIFTKEGYSRIPLYHEQPDQIIGILLYKDLFFQLSNQKISLDAPIQPLVKPAIYTPETKKAALLLQEFRTKQAHLAIVVNEYGSMEGIITLEDILEEFVGNIADEYDEREEAYFQELPSGGWIVDGKMGILDIEKELGIQIPSGSDYDSIGGYIIYKAGMIPRKGWRIHQDHFELEVLLSNDRCIEKVRISPSAPPEE